jgi:NADPH-dependent curcumin reductase CurA
VRAGACPTEPGILIMTVTANRQWRLKRRPSGQFDQADFELATVPIPEMRDGEFLVRLTHLSVDPTQRIWAHEESYISAESAHRGFEGWYLRRSPHSRMSASLQER